MKQGLAIPTYKEMLEYNLPTIFIRLFYCHVSRFDKSQHFNSACWGGLLGVPAKHF